MNNLFFTGWDKKLRNAIYNFIQTSPKLQFPAPPTEHIKEPLAYLRKAQVNILTIRTLEMHR